MLVWEELNNGGAIGVGHCYTYRTKAPGGRLVLVNPSATDEGMGITFFPDPNHQWDDGNSI
ncbi:MAG: hypothetical protein JRJ49_07775 [Deltaproteobacteria bacterium]|nr:hypothetical protein [Deltaproteobacteria bacterium]